jgi:hypothetical protein
LGERWADSSHAPQSLQRAEGTAVSALLDDARRERRADPWETLKLVGGR